MTLEVRNWTSEYYITNESSCQDILKNPNALNEIPLLNDVQSHDIKDKQLVRFRGMIQDMYNPEYYLKQYEVKNVNTGESVMRCGMYADAAQCLPHEEICLDFNKNENAERQTYIVISIPGLNDWAKEKNLSVQKSDATRTINTSKRNLDANDVEEMDCSEPVTKKEKILASNTDIDMDNAHSATTAQSTLSEEHILNFPIPINKGKACIVKVYDGTVLKLNQVIDIIGFISLDPMLSTVRVSEDDMNEAEINTHNPPASLVPRLHTIKITELTKPEIPNDPEIISKAQLIRDDLHLMFTYLIFGDRLAADYLICHLLSKIYMRRDYFCLGTFPLNITNFPTRFKTFPKMLYNFLTLLVKKSHFFEVTLENLNELALIPKKDYECNRLTSGILQLSDNTHLVLDETGLTTGELTVTGKENYKALCDVLLFQKLPYDFKYYTMEYETDISILILSNAKSFISCPMQVILDLIFYKESEDSALLEAVHELLEHENRLSNIRQYLETLRHAEFVCNEEVTKVIQDDFVQLRSEDRTISADNLHTLMVFARLMSLSYGKTELDIDCWKKTLSHEVERMNRLKMERMNRLP